MSRMLKLLPLLLALLTLMAEGQNPTNKPQSQKDIREAATRNTTGLSAPDLTRQPTLYVVGYAHLDTQWRWGDPKVIKKNLPDKLDKNFDFFEKNPHYIFNFYGANPYRMIK